MEGAEHPEPFVWIVDRYCEEFGCGIREALYDLENAPQLLISAVLDQRSFVRTKGELDRAKTAADGPAGPMSDRVWAAIEAIKEDKERERGRPDGR